MAYITVGTENSADIELFYTDQGSGQPVVLIHGFPLNGESWGKQQAALLDAGYRVIAYDRRGFGASTKAGSGYDYRHVRRRPARAHRRPRPAGRGARGLLDGHRRDRPLPVALRQRACREGRVPRLARAVPARRRRTTPAAPVRRSSSTASPRTSRKDRYAFVGRLLQGLLQPRREPRLAHLAGGAGRAASQVANHAGNTAIAAAPLTWPTDFRADIPHIDVPALIVHGTADNILPIDVTARRFKELLPDATYVEIEGAPHGLLLDPRRRGERGAAGVPQD